MARLDIRASISRLISGGYINSENTLWSRSVWMNGWIIIGGFSIIILVCSLSLVTIRCPERKRADFLQSLKNTCPNRYNTGCSPMCTWEQPLFTVRWEMALKISGCLGEVGGEFCRGELEWCWIQSHTKSPNSLSFIHSFYQFLPRFRKF